MPSVTVVLPASMCAIIPMFLVASMGYSRGIYFLSPSVTKSCKVGKRFVSFSHAVSIFALLHGRTLLIEGIHNFRGQLFRHRRAFAGACGGNQPLHTQRGAAGFH